MAENSGVKKNKKGENEIRDAISLAERLAESGLRLRVFEKNAPPLGDLTEKPHLDKLKAEVEKNKIAAELLPQARKIVKMRWERKRIIEESVLSALAQVFLAWKQWKIGGDKWESAYEEFPFWQPPLFKANEHNAALRRLKTDLVKWNTPGIIENLEYLLSEAKMELFQINLPPKPPKYRYRGARYDSG